MAPDYAAIDTKKIIDFLVYCGGSCSYDELKAFSGANPLRLESLLLRLKQELIIDFPSLDPWGSPTVVSLLS